MMRLPTGLMGVGSETCEAWDDLRMEREAPVSSRNLMGTPVPCSKPKPMLAGVGKDLD